MGPVECPALCTNRSAWKIYFHHRIVRIFWYAKVCAIKMASAKWKGNACLLQNPPIINHLVGEHHQKYTRSQNWHIPASRCVVRALFISAINFECDLYKCEWRPSRHCLFSRVVFESDRCLFHSLTDVRIASSRWQNVCVCAAFAVNERRRLSTSRS